MLDAAPTVLLAARSRSFRSGSSPGLCLTGCSVVSLAAGLRGGDCCNRTKAAWRDGSSSAATGLGGVSPSSCLCICASRMCCILILASSLSTCRGGGKGAWWAVQAHSSLQHNSVTAHFSTAHLSTAHLDTAHIGRIREICYLILPRFWRHRRQQLTSRYLPLPATHLASFGVTYHYLPLPRVTYRYPLLTSRRLASIFCGRECAAFASIGTWYDRWPKLASTARASAASRWPTSSAE